VIVFHPHHRVALATQRSAEDGAATEQAGNAILPAWRLDPCSVPALVASRRGIGVVRDRIGLLLYCKQDYLCASSVDCKLSEQADLLPDVEMI
jgi:hypothetical protein